MYIQLILSSDDAPLYFNYQNDLGQGATLADDAVAQYCALLGLDEFTDWQYPEWGTAVRDFGAAGYSETAQVYAVANAGGYSVTLSAASMTPQYLCSTEHTSTGRKYHEKVPCHHCRAGADPDSLPDSRSRTATPYDRLRAHGSRSSPPPSSG